MSLPRPVYLDYAATTPVDLRVVDEMLPFFHEHFGNSSSIHFYGQKAEAALEDARAILAQGLNCTPKRLFSLHVGQKATISPCAVRPWLPGNFARQTIS
jgi:cysteine sulfinate desulfinase/cysteine desulfurase-like protein